MRAGLFEHWQAEYAARRVATFPVGRDKNPSVRGYLRVGSKASEQLAIRFPDATGIGLACARNKITVLDVDTSDERVLAGGLSRFGDTPFIVRSGSGNFQAWYRRNGEGRHIRPDPAVPVDILGDGFVVAPPSQAANGTYRIIQGSLDDLPGLPTMRRDPANRSQSERLVTGNLTSEPFVGMREGDGRNNAMLTRGCRMALSAETKDILLAMMMEANAQFAEPLPIDEVRKIACSIWRYKTEGRLMIGGGEATAVIFKSDTAHLWDQPLALVLLVKLRLAHGWRDGGEFALSLATAETLGVSPKTFRAARDALVSRRFLQITYPGGRGKSDPPRARLM